MKRDPAKTAIFLLSVLALGVGFLLPDSLITAGVVLLCMLAALAILYRNLPRLSGVSEDNPKVRSLRQATAITLTAAAAVTIAALLIESGTFTPTEPQIKLLLSLFLSALIMVFGNIAPRLPFNRYTGLRLPWTVRDEETWIVAHRLLGYLSMPVGLICLAGIRSRLPFDTWMKVWFAAPLLLWIGVPSLLSGLFFWKKWRNV